MSRPPRIISKTGLYHVIFRGINKQNLFEETADYEKMSDIILRIKQEKSFKLHAYCFMPNHVHLFLEEKIPGDIKKIMHKLLTSYVGWFNFKYQRSGSLIGNRYKSEPIEDERYYFALMRYIHQNPVKAGLTDDVKKYRYSSYNDYISQKSGFVNIDFFLDMFSEKRDAALRMFKEYHEMPEVDDFDISDSKKPTVEQLKRALVKITNGINAEEIILLPKAERNELIRMLRQEGFTIGQLERLTGISRAIITRAKTV